MRQVGRDRFRRLLDRGEAGYRMGAHEALDMPHPLLLHPRHDVDEDERGKAGLLPQRMERGDAAERGANGGSLGAEAVLGLAAERHGVTAEICEAVMAASDPFAVAMAALVDADGGEAAFGEPPGRRPPGMAGLAAAMEEQRHLRTLAIEIGREAVPGMAEEGRLAGLQGHAAIRVARAAQTPMRVRKSSAPALKTLSPTAGI